LGLPSSAFAVGVWACVWADADLGGLALAAATLVALCAMLGVALFWLRRQIWIALIVIVIVIAAYVAVSASVLIGWSDARVDGRWAILSPEFKAEAAHQGALPAGALLHFELDSWGFVDDTDVYAVYDPTDSLVPTIVKGDAHIPQLNCDVAWIRREERFWYAVMFYTATTWNDCPATR
jgi:hypothetical protein